MRKIILASVLVCCLAASSVRAEETSDGDGEFAKGVRIGELASDIDKMREDLEAMRVQINEMHTIVKKLKPSDDKFRSVADVPPKCRD